MNKSSVCMKLCFLWFWDSEIVTILGTGFVWLNTHFYSSSCFQFHLNNTEDILKSMQYNTIENNISTAINCLVWQEEVYWTYTLMNDESTWKGDTPKERIIAFGYICTLTLITENLHCSKHIGTSRTTNEILTFGKWSLTLKI